MNKGNKLSLLAYDFTLFVAWLLPPANVDIVPRWWKK